MVIQKIIASTLFAGLILGLQLIAPQNLNAQIITDCGCQEQPICGCGQSTCDSCCPQVETCGCGVVGCRGGCLGKRVRGCERCPSCNAEVCISESKMEKEKRSCWKTEQKIICIPKVRFPWQKCDGPQCGKTKTITLLKKHSYECEVCKHTWKIVKPELPETPTDAKKTSSVPIVQPGLQTVQPFDGLPPSAPVVNSLPFESNIIPASTPRIIQGTPRIIQGNGGR